ncbi:MULTISPECIES: hypothetical protein [Burkholderia]|uniref:hypothetical protein n=1 Tax=Burkholderia TaxID=32008 RepID=UPI0011AF2B1B|nr:MULTISPECIES: hypothetical protein [unclassified Burkholderia]
MPIDRFDATRRSAARKPRQIFDGMITMLRFSPRVYESGISTEVDWGAASELPLTRRLGLITRMALKPLQISVKSQFQFDDRTESFQFNLF